MKLIYIINMKVPTEKAYGYQICKMCEEFARFGLEVELWVPERKNRIKKDPFTYYDLKKNFEIKKIKSFDFIRFSKYLGKYAFWLHIFVYFIKLLTKKIEKEIIIYSRNPEIIWLFGLKGYQIIFEIHRWSKKNWLFKFFIKKTKKIIAVTQELKRLCLKSGFKKKDILVAPDAVDLKIFDLDISKDEARQKIGLPSNKIILGYTGSFRTMGKDKGIIDIFKALKILSVDYPDILFLAIGGNENDIRVYQKIAADLKINNNTLLLERVNILKVAFYQKACDILLMPFPYTKHFAYYMSPLKMFEYMASKRPIIASDLPSVREILNDDNAFLVKPANIEDLAEAIKTILKDKELSQRKIQQAYLDVQQYTWKKRAKKIIEFFSK